jgi:toxin YoeB
MTVVFTPNAWEEYLLWQQENETVLLRINSLIKEIQRDPFRGTGKPEPLRGNLTGYWSRRITGEHRIVYRVSGSKANQTLTIIQVRLRY